MKARDTRTGAFHDCGGIYTTRHSPNARLTLNSPRTDLGFPSTSLISQIALLVVVAVPVSLAHPSRKELFRPIETMGEYCSWVMGFLLPSLWEAEVAVSAAALLVAAVLLLFLDQTTSNTTHSSASSSSASPATTSYHHRDGGRGRSCAKGKKAVAQLGGTSKVRPDMSWTSLLIWTCIDLRIWRVTALLSLIKPADCSSGC